MGRRRFQATPGPNAINLRRLSAKTFFRQRDAVKAGVHSRALHDIGTQLPAKVWIAIPHKARSPVTGLPVRVVRFSGASLRYGIEDAEFEGVPVRITSPARTIVDCFRFRRIVGMDVALEAICDAVADRRVTPAQIRRRRKLAAHSHWYAPSFRRWWRDAAAPTPGRVRLGERPPRRRGPTPA